jgi:hypothetical protein
VSDGGRTVTPNARGRGAATVLAALLLLAAGCSSTAARDASGSTKPSTPGTTSTTVGTLHGQSFLAPEVGFGRGQNGAPDPTTSVPTDTGTVPINATNDAGQEVIIAKGGYLLPEWLVAEVNLPITWTNLSGVPQQVVFDDAPVHSAILAPGATFTWKSPGYAISLRYHTVNGHHAQLTLQSPNDNS